MSFGLGFYKDVLLNKLGAAKDRAAAILRELDNCEVRLQVVNTNSRHDTLKMPVVRSRSKSKCKHSFFHEEERFHGPRHYDDWSSDGDYDSDCSCGEHDTAGRGRRPYRDADIYVDGRNVEQQNILVKGCCGGKCKHVHRKRPRSRSVIVVDRPRQGHPYGSRRPCVHGFDFNDFCGRCPSGQRSWEPTYHMSHQVITDDDGKINFYDPTKLRKYLCEQVHAYAKSEADKKAATEKTMSETMGMLKKTCIPKIMDGSCGCGGHHHHYGYGSYNGPRSAQDIENELARVNADLEQLHTRALLEAQAQALANCVDESSEEELAMCSGALQEDSNDDERLHKHRGSLGQRRPKSILPRARPKRVNFADEIKHSPCRIQEVEDEGDLLRPRQVARCCSRRT